MEQLSSQRCRESEVLSLREKAMAASSSSAPPEKSPWGQEEELGGLGPWGGEFQHD